jgi:hypothetical protein
MVESFLRNRRPRKAYRPTIEALESRLTPDVTAALLGSDLVVVGDQQSYNVANIVQLPDNTFLVNGTGLPNTTFGAITGNIVVTMGSHGGYDIVTIEILDIPGSILVTLGAGDTNVNIMPTTTPGPVPAGSLVLFGGAGNDNVSISQIQFSGNAVIALAAGNHDIEMVGGTPSDGGYPLQFSGNARITLGAGHDTIALAGVIVTGTTEVDAAESSYDNVFVSGKGFVSGETILNDNATFKLGGTDYLNFQGTANQDLKFNGGTVANNITLGKGSQVNGNAKIRLGDHENLSADNHLYLDGTVNGNLRVDGSAGANTVTLDTDSVVNGNVRIDLGYGVNAFSFAGVINGGSLTYLGGSEQDTVNFAGQVLAAGNKGGDVYVLLDGGFDLFNLLPGENVPGYFLVDGGGGNSTFDGTAVGGLGDVKELRNFETILPP